MVRNTIPKILKLKALLIVLPLFKNKSPLKARTNIKENTHRTF